MQMDKDELLNKAKELLKVEMTEIAYETWFGPVEITEMTDTTIVLKASSKYAREMLETRYADLILILSNISQIEIGLFLYLQMKTNKTEKVGE